MSAIPVSVNEARVIGKLAPTRPAVRAFALSVQPFSKRGVDRLSLSV